jgi:hypothetical protein
MANDEARMTNDDAKGLPESRRYDLAERTAQFGEQLIRFARKIKDSPACSFGNQRRSELGGGG